MPVTTANKEFRLIDIPHRTKIIVCQGLWVDRQVGSEGTRTPGSRSPFHPGADASLQEMASHSAIYSLGLSGLKLQGSEKGLKRSTRKG